VRVFVSTDQLHLQFIIDFFSYFISISTIDSSCGVLNIRVSCKHLKCSCSTCGMVKIKKDAEIAQHIDQCDSDLLSETDESFKYLLESDSSMPEQTPKVTVWHSSIM